MQQIMEMLVEMKAKADADREERRGQAKMDAEMKTYQEMLARMEAKTGINLKELRSTIGAIEEKVGAWIADRKDGRKETVSCQLMMGVCLDSKEQNLEDMESRVECREIPTKRLQ
jgi:hypothetical protein